MKIPANNSAMHHSQSTTKLWLLAGVVLLLILSLLMIPAVQAQTPATDLAALEVEIWPDFDRPSVLVLLTGTLADDVPVPATMILPLPDDATVNAVAHVDVASGELQNISDVDTSPAGEIHFTTPSPTFRIEYYLPYTLDGERRDFTFDWRSDLAIEQLLTTVQQPAEASDFELSPASDQPTSGQDGLTYHPLAALSLPAGQSYAVSGSYNLSGDLLTADVMTARQPAVEGPLPVVSDPVQDNGSDFNWPLVAIVAGGLVIVAALAWFLYTNYQSGQRRPPKPRPERRTSSRSKSSSTSAAQYCHHCGRAVDAEDKFCRECGTAVKGR